MSDPRPDLAKVIPLLDRFGACPVVENPMPHDPDITTDVYDDLVWELFIGEYPEFGEAS